MGGGAVMFWVGLLSGYGHFGSREVSMRLSMLAACASVNTPEHIPR
jgi:hypothetical protein